MSLSGTGAFELYLAGFVPLTDHGYALPCFAAAEHENAWYVATSSHPLDHNGRILSFDIFQPEGLVRLPASKLRSAVVGEAWIDVFLWNGSPHVGTPIELWNELRPYRSEIFDRAPLSLLDLSNNLDGVDKRTIALRAFEFLEAKFGQPKALQWRNESYLRLCVIRSLYRMLNTELFTNTVSRVFHEITITSETDGALNIEIPKSLIKEIEIDQRLDSLLEDARHAASLFNLAAPTIAAPRAFDWQMFVAEPSKLSDTAAARPLQEIAAFLTRASRQQHSIAIDALWRALLLRIDTVPERAFNTPPSHLVAFLNVAAQQDQRDFGEKLWKAIDAQPDRLTEYLLSTTLDDLSVFLDTAYRQDQKSMVGRLWDALAAQLARLVERAYETSIDHVRALLRIADQQGQSVLIEDLWRAIASQRDRLQERASDLLPRELVAMLTSAPDYVRKQVVGGFSVERWSYDANQVHRFSTGAPGLAGLFGLNGRSDLKNALVENILMRRNPADFNELGVGLIEMSRMASFVEPHQQIAFVELIDNVCTEEWLEGCYRYGSTTGLAGALHMIAVHQPRAVIRRFWSQALARRLRREFSQLATRDDFGISAVIQLLGTAQLSGSKISSSLFEGVPLARISRLPKIIGHRSTAKIVEQWQRQLWFGLRVVASTALGPLIVDPESTNQTLDLWRRNIDGAGDWPGTKEQPDTTAHRINASMVDWLTRCVSIDGGALFPNQEPLWALTGFPSDPNDLKS
jgi:hypothetical protein